MTPLPHSTDFRLSITQALESQLIAAFKTLAPIPLTQAALATVDSRPGVYRLHYPSPRVVYVGKAETDIRVRLTSHLRKLAGRKNIMLSGVGFTYVTVEEDLTAIAPETVMIRWQATQPGGSAWNGSGFGSRDPGQRRDTSTPGVFDSTYPIDLTTVPTLIPPGDHRVEELFRLFRGAGGSPPALPFPLRAQKNAKSDFAETTVSVRPGMTIASLMREIVDALNRNLPRGAREEWQATALPGTLILYRERPRGGPFKHYTHSLEQW